jgi:uncharacterized protein
MTAKHHNALIHETSPYLLQHAHNPVEWFPWGKSALEKAQKEDKMLLISIGYSACHWCHVMEKESFMDEQVAAVMNRFFVCVKVDREEHPDVDQVYMDAVQLMSGQGGWPLNCFALPDGRPVYGGTYFRKNDWMNLMQQLSTMYANEKERLMKQATLVQEGVLAQENAQVREEREKVTAKYLQEGIRNMAKGFDLHNGGFNGAPKFPMPSVWEYLLSFLHHFNDQPLQNQLYLTLNKMALGGIYDHVGGGFARYSVDEQWHIPHFEKMLYDNAQLMSLYSKAYVFSNQEHYRRVVYETHRFVAETLTSPEGAFYAALDADSEGEEGKFYSWTADELKYHLGENYPLLAEYYSITAEGNWEHGQNVLKSKTTAEQFSLKKQMPLNDFLGLLEMAESKLRSERNERVHPGLDNKIITAWNALMLKAYLDAYQAFGQDYFLESALKNARFIRQHLLAKGDTLFRTYQNGKAKINGFLDDHAFTISAYIQLYQITFDESWLELAHQISQQLLQNFADPDGDYFFYTSALDEPLAVRKKEMGDNVIPASNSVMAENLLNLSLYYHQPEYEEKALKMVKNMAFEVHTYGRFYSNWGRVLLSTTFQPKEIVITGPDAFELASDIRKQYRQPALYAASRQNSGLPIFTDRFTEGKNTIYICENRHCMLPVHTLDEALNLLHAAQKDS